MAQVWIDLDKISELSNLSRWWSVEKFNIVSFYRKDYLSGDLNLKQAVINKIFSETGIKFTGKVFLLTNLRYWGHCFNPVSFYFCYDADGQLQFILEEINNTPWNERHCYVHDCNNSQQKLSKKDLKQVSSQDDYSQENIIKQKQKFSFHFEKAFHVSPFMPMNLFYQWHYMINKHSIIIHMELFDHLKSVDEMTGARKFYANLHLNASELNKKTANQFPVKFPFLCAKVVVGIYWNALKLWLKRVPLYSHPKS